MQIKNHLHLLFKKIGKKKLTPVLVLFVLFFVKSYFFLDPDFGWHFKMGELIMQKGVPQTDPFSYTMPSYPFVDHEWLSNITISYLFSHIGIVGLCVLFSLCAIFAIKIATYLMPKFVSSTLSIPIGVVLLPFVGVRVQVMSWAYCSLLMLAFLHYEKERYIKYIIPLGILLWSNTHGSFPLGILILFLFYVSKYIKRKHIYKEDGVIFAFSLFITLLPPYGWRRWWEVWMQIGDGGLRWNVQEWAPIFSSDFNVALICYLALSVSLLIKYFHRIDLFLKIVYFVFLFMAISSIRHIPLWLCVSSFQAGICFKFLYREIQITKSRQKITIFLRYFLFIACIVQIVISSVSLLSEIRQNTYPEKAVGYLIQKNIKGNVLSVYNWGGYLIWKYPDKKVFVDGRMPSWRFKAPNKKESNNAFFEWKRLLSGKIKLSEAKRKYNIEIALMPTREKMYMCRKPSRWLYFTHAFSDGQEQDIFKNEKIIYQDETATIYLLN